MEVQNDSQVVDCR